jgi:hypothetical protein
VPPERTIEEILERAGATKRQRPRRRASKGIPYPAPAAARAGEVVQVDFVGPRHLDGGVRFHALNQIDVASHHAGRWKHLGRQRYPNAPSLTITADCGGSNSNLTGLWKAGLQKLSDETGLEITWFASSLPEPANGTRSSTGCSATSGPTGAASRLKALRSSST